MAINPRFRSLLLQALREFSEAGYTSPGDLQQWLMRLHRALEVELPADDQMRQALIDALQTIFSRDVDKLGLVRRVPGVTRYTLAQLSPQLRAELDRRIFAGTDLIKINRAKRIQETLQRFSGWVTSVPPGGSAVTNLRAVARHIEKPSKQVRYEARRVAIDQTHKLSSAVAHVVAKHEGAIAAIWHDRGEHDHGYDARPEHLKRSGKVFLIRESWAMDQGLLKRGATQYTDEFEQPAELPFCSCTYEYVTSPARLSQQLLTAKGQAWLTTLDKPVPHLRAV